MGITCLSVLLLVALFFFNHKRILPRIEDPEELARRLAGEYSGSGACWLAVGWSGGWRVVVVRGGR